MEMDGFQWRLEAEDQTHGKENGMRDRTEKMIGGVSVLLLLFMVTRWKLFERCTGPLDRTSGLLFTQGAEGQSCDHLVRGPWGGAYWSVYMGYSIL